MTIAVIQLIEETVSPVALIGAIERDSSSPKNALIVSVMPSDYTMASISVIGHSKENVSVHKIDQTEMPSAFPGIIPNQEKVHTQYPVINDIEESNSAPGPINAIERDSSSPKNALIVSVMGSDYTMASISEMGDSVDDLNLSSMAVDGKLPQMSFLHAISDLAGNAVADQKMRGGT